MFEIAESIDDVRGKDRASGRIVVALIFVDVEDRGECGGEIFADLLWGSGELNLRNWL